MHPRPEDFSLPAILYALGDPVRLSIVRTLAREGERCCTDAAEECDVPKSTQSHHMRILRESGLIRTRKEGRQYLSLLRREEVEARFPGVLSSVLSQKG